MKQLASAYSISGANVTLTGVNVPLNQILLVADATTGNVLYSMAGPAATSYTQATNSAITLATTPGATDKLTIYYDDGVAPLNAPQISQPLTDTQLRATAVPVSGTVTVNAGTNLNTSALATETGNLATIATNTGKIPSKGAATTANSTPVNIASDQTVPVSVSSGTLTLTSSTNATIGQYNSSLPTVSNGAYVAPQTDSSGKLLIQGGNSTAVAVSGTFWQTTQPVSGTVTSNRGSGSITLTATTVGTTSATLLAASAATKFLRVQNNSATATLYVSKVTPATSTNSIVVGPTTGANYYWEPGFIPTDTLYILASAASTPYTLTYA